MDTEKAAIKAVAFDLYDTLVYRDRQFYRAARRQMAKIAEVPYELFSQSWENLAVESNMGIHLKTTSDRVTKILQKLNGRRDESVVQAIVKIEHEALRKHVHSFADVPTFLKRLERSPYKVVVVSNCSSSVQAVLQSPGLRIDDKPFMQYFDVIVLSYEVHVRKPNARIYQIALDRVGMIPIECLYIGDDNDLELYGAFSAGMTTFSIQRPGHSYGGNTSSDPEYINYTIESLEELGEFLPEID